MSTQSQSGYLLLYRSDESYKNLSREELQQLIARNIAWFERLAAEGKIKAGQALERKGVTVSGQNGIYVSDGPFAETKEVIGGYLLLDVETFEEAVAIAQSSPGLSCGASIDVRPVANECPLDSHERALAREEQPAVA